MWSGPRNVSTALMRSFESRADTAVVDEPFYAAWLAATGTEHPGREEVLRRHETDWQVVVERLLGPLEDGKRVSYQKHMAHHLLPEMDRDWIGVMQNALLIRDPARMLVSLTRIVPDPRLEDTGLVQQVELFERLRAEGEAPPVVDAKELLLDPEGVLRALCHRLEIPFDPAMLSWERGPRPSDGIWGRHWYAGTYRSTGFEPWEPGEPVLPRRLEKLHARCRELWLHLHEHRLRARH